MFEPIRYISQTVAFTVSKEPTKHYSISITTTSMHQALVDAGFDLTGTCMESYYITDIVSCDKGIETAIGDSANPDVVIADVYRNLFKGTIERKFPWKGYKLLRMKMPDKSVTYIDYPTVVTEDTAVEIPYEITSLRKRYAGTKMVDRAIAYKD